MIEAIKKRKFRRLRNMYRMELGILQYERVRNCCLNLNNYTINITLTWAA